MEDFNYNRLRQYETYKDCVNIKICTKEGKYIRQDYMGKLIIRSDVPLRIGIDQSKSQTGIAVKKKTGELICLLDIVNVSGVPYNLYKAMLGLKMEQLFCSCEVEICVVEKMWGGNKDAYEMLSELGKFLAGYKYILDGWRNAEVAEILPNVWRSSYLADKKYKGQFSKDKVKVAAMKEGIVRYPQLHNYGMFHKEGVHVNDSFDALGILEGYEDKTFAEDGEMRRISNTTVMTNHKYSDNVFICNDKEDLTDIISQHCPRRMTVEYEYNKDMSVNENLRRATSLTNKIVYMLVNDNITKIQMMWKYGVVIEEDEKVYVVGWRNNISTKLGNY